MSLGVLSVLFFAAAYFMNKNNAEEDKQLREEWYDKR